MSNAIPTDIEEDFCDRLREWREHRGLTSSRLAKLAGLSRPTVLNLEHKAADPRLSTLVKLARALDCKPWQLIPGNPDGRLVTVWVGGVTDGELRRESEERRLHFGRRAAK